ncbi:MULTISPECIES: hypothetical protein [Halorussus]|uniref:hypothetical protein n=1 Tax=Halorussus TaxID=1070314 RepID=UPI00209DDE7E|nr:hypothetical protein [Halorussus vallis]USZ75039.1 hypothetical protein NGM07_16565 [Halorussus vallis]
MDSSNRGRRGWRSAGALALVGLLALALAGLRRATARAADVPLSPLTGGWRVGADYPERRGIVTEEAVAGEMDDVTAFARPGFGPDRLHPEVRDFYEKTADYDLTYAVEWHRPFRFGAALASRLTSRLEQLNLPGPREGAVRELRSRFAAVDPAADPRAGTRAWVRTRPDGRAVFVALYAHHDREGTRYVNIAVPLPGANLSTVLRPELLEFGDPDGAGLELTTLGGEGDGGGGDGDGDEGLFLLTPLGALALPLDQRFRVRPAGASETDAPADVEFAEPGAQESDLEAPSGIVATHEMWVFGRRFLTVEYAAGTEDSSGSQ